MNTLKDLTQRLAQTTSHKKQQLLHRYRVFRKAWEFRKKKMTLILPNFVICLFPSRLLPISLTWKWVTDILALIWRSVQVLRLWETGWCRDDICSVLCVSCASLSLGTAPCRLWLCGAGPGLSLNAIKGIYMLRTQTSDTLMNSNGTLLSIMTFQNLCLDTSRKSCQDWAYKQNTPQDCKWTWRVPSLFTAWLLRNRSWICSPWWIQQEQTLTSLDFMADRLSVKILWLRRLWSTDNGTLS